MRLHWEKIEETDIHQAEKAKIIIGTLSQNKFTTEKVIRKEILEKQLSEELQDLKKLPKQGTLIDINNADYLLSQNIYRNFKISDNMLNFWYKARHNVLPCHYTLSLWYPEHQPECRLDGYHLNRMSHILNGCKKMKNNYTKRHDHILERISSELTHHCEKIYVNKTIKTAFPEILEESTILDLKPDIVMKVGTDVSIIDIACPYDLYIESIYEAKLEKYRCIQEFLANKKN